MPHPDGEPTPLTHFARRVESDPTFLASQLAAYRDSHGLTDEDLCAYLGVPLADWPRLALCGRLTTSEHVAAVAGRFGCDAGRLGEILRDAP